MKIRLSLVTFFLVFFAIRMYATDYYVNAVTGSNTTGNGSSVTPWKTITYALVQISGTGHIVHVAAGTYNTTLGETFPITIKNSVSLSGAGDLTTIINAGGTQRVMNCIGITDPSTVIEGFTISGGALTSTSSQGGGILISAGSVLTIRYNTISSNSLGTLGYGGGIYIANSSPTIYKNTISGNSISSSGYGNAVAIYNSNPLLKRNRIIKNTSGYSGCIYVYGSSSSPRIINNVIAKNSNQGIYCDAGEPTIINNTISENSSDGIFIGYGRPDSIMNNILSFNAGYGINEDNPSYDPVKVSYNMFFSNDGGLYFDERTTAYYTALLLNSTLVECENNIDGDPFFVDRVNNDYHEKAYSPAINAGDPSLVYNNEPSPNGGRINIGAYGNTEEAVAYVEPPVLPPDLFVNATIGSNTTGDGSSGYPWKTITYALSQIVSNGFTIHVSAGTYNTALGETFPIEMKNGVSLAGAGASTTIINADKNNRVLNCVGITDLLTYIEGFTITGGFISGNFQKGGGIYLSGGTVLTLRNNIITNNELDNWGEGGGIFISRSSPHIVNNDISNNTAGWVSDGNAIAIYSSSPLIEKNVFTGNTGTGALTSSCIFISDYNYLSGSPRIKGNLIAKNYQNGILCDQGSPSIINNTISDNSGNGIYISYGKPDSCNNNIISYNTGYGIYEDGSPYDPGKVWYNIFYGNEGGLYYDEASTGYYTASSLNASVAECKNNNDGEPSFVNKTINNYHIQSGSPAINAGDPNSPLDPDGSLADIGAYYYIPPPDSPVALDATSITQSGFQSNWNASAGATGYYLDVANDAGFTVFFSGFNNKNVQDVTTYLITGLTANTQYFCRIRAYNATGTSASSNVISVATLQIPAPITPTAISASGITQTSFYANWNASATATGYYLDVATDNTFTSFVTGYNNKALANVITSPVSGLSPNTTYYYRVRAFNAGGTSASSNMVSPTTLQIAPPAAPLATPATSITQTSFYANWNASATATEYYTDVATDGGFINLLESYTNYNAGNVTTLLVTGLTPNTTYYYRVRAYNAGGTSSNSTIVIVTTLPIPPSSPTATAATNISQTSFTANWIIAATATGYYLDVATDNTFASFVSGFDSKDVSNITAISVTGLSANTNYYYRVRAYNAGGSSSNSSTIQTTTLINPPSAPVATSATNATQTGFTANWGASATATGYYLDVATNNTFSSFVSGYNNKNVGNIVAASVAGLSASTIYYFRVRAYNAGGSSSNSSTIQTTTLVNPPSAPVPTAATNISQTSFTANWNIAATATGYYLDVATDNTFASFISGFDSKDVSTITTISVAGLSANTNYYYRVRAYNAGGSSSNSSTIQTTTLINPPSAPVATSATNATQTGFTANWSASATATGYYLDVATNNTFTSFVSGYNNKNVGNIVAASVAGLSASTIYYFRVRAYNAGGSSSNSSTIQTTTLVNPPSAPVPTAATNISQTSFTANWNIAATATGYYLDVATDITFASFVSGFDSKDVSNITAISVTGLSANTNYYYRIRAYNAGGTSSNSIIISTVTLALPPSVPTANDPTSIVQRSFTANWSSATNATGYYLDVSTNSSFATFIAGFNNKDVLNVLSLSITGLSGGTTYYYRVRAYSTGGTSENSNTITVNTLPILVSNHYVNVSTGNNSSGDGTISKPWKTITYALEHITGIGRHNIHVAAGTYNSATGEAFPLMPGDSISLIGAGKDVTIIDAGSSNTVIKFSGILDPGVSIKSFTITGGKSIVSNNAGGIYVSGGSVLTITDNLITANRAEESASGGAVFVYNASPCIVKNTISLNHGQIINDGASIYVSGASSAPRISENTFTGNINDIIDGGVIGAGTLVISGSSGTLVINNIFLNNNPGGGYSNSIDGGEIYIINCSPTIKYNLIAKSKGNGIYIYNSAAYPTIINNTISDNTYDGIYLYSSKPDSIFNNIISYNAGYGINEGNSASDPGKVWYNLFYQNSLGLYNNEGSNVITSVTTLNSTVTESKNNLTGNPLFNDKTNSNYRLASGSAAINAGDPASPLDPDNTIADIGAYYRIPPPVIPVATAASNITYSGFQSNWNASSTATGYYLDIATDGEFTVFVSGFNNKNVANVTTLAITGLPPNKTFYYRVRAYNADGTSPSSNVITLTTEQIPAPPAPTANAASSIGQTDFTANWSSSETATGYFIDIATDNSFTSFVTGYNNKDLLNVMSYNITGLSANTSYYYRVRAYNTGGTSPSSNTITLTTLLNPPDPPSAPVAIPASKITMTSFTANWNSVTGASGYRLDVATDNSFTSYLTGYNNKEITNSTSDSIGGLTLSTNYYYRVRATNSGVISSSSNTIAATTLSNPPASPVCTSATSVTQYTFTANWNSAATATGYRIDVSTESSFSTFLSGYNDKDVGNVTNSSVTGLSLNTSYYYRIRAYNSGGTSGNSNTISITTLLNAPTLPSAPTALNATVIMQTGFTARWNTSSTSTGYYIDVSSSSTFTTYLSGYFNKYVGNVTSTTVTGLTQKNSYYYRIRASNAYGTSGNSNTITVTTLPNAPSAPSGLTAVSCNDQVTLSWSANTETDFLRYMIYGGLTANTTTLLDSTATGTVSATSKTLSGLTHAKTYYFRITAVVSPGVPGPFSTEANVLIRKGVIPKIKGKFNKVLICYNTGDSINVWQWYNGTTAISGAIKQYYVMNEASGSYSVQSTDKNGCKNSSNIINITGAKSISVYPNPARNSFMLNFSSETFGRVIITLYNSSGVKIIEYQKEKTDEVLKCEIPVDKMLDGIYTIEVLVNEEELSFSRVVIIN